MPKKVSDSQIAGTVGEKGFSDWAAKMGWFPTKYDPDQGIDFACQIIGNRISATSWEMPGNIINVSVRSTKRDSDDASIDRNDAELLLTTNIPMVLAIVQRAPLGKESPVAIKFVDEQFIKELDAFLQSPSKTHTVRFSEAITDPQAIHSNVERLLRESYPVTVARIRTENLLKDLAPESVVEIRYTAYGTNAHVYFKKPYEPIDIFHKTKIERVLW